MGGWSLVRCWIEFSDARPPLEPFGPGASGLLLYQSPGADGWGWMSATLARAGRSALGTSLETSGRAGEAQKAAAFDSLLHYAGRWSLEAGAGGPRVAHRVEFALLPELVGQVQRRRVRWLSAATGGGPAAVGPAAVGPAAAGPAAGPGAGAELELSYRLRARSGVERRYRLWWRRAEGQGPGSVA